jgi:hypothetical protein
MADWDTDAAGYSAELAGRRGAGPPATFGDIWSANWREAGLDTLTGSGKPMTEAYENLIDQTEKAVGPVHIAAQARGLDWFGTTGMERKAQLVGQIIAGLPEEKRKELEPLVDIRGRAVDAAAKIESDAADVAGRTYGLSGLATSWLAGMSRQVVDPVNLAVGAIGGPEAGLLATLGRSALIAAVGQAIQEPAIEAQRSQLGLDAGMWRALTNVGEVGVGAAALPLLFKGAGMAVRKIRGAPIAPGDLDAAAMLADRNNVMAVADPEHLENTASALELGKVFEMGRGLVAGLEAVAPQTLPVVNPELLTLLGREAGLRQRLGELEKEIPAANPLTGTALVRGQAASETLARLATVEKDLGAATTDAERSALSSRRDELLADTTPEALRELAAPVEKRRQLESERTNVTTQLEDIGKKRAQYAPTTPVMIGQRMAVPHSPGPKVALTGRPEVDAVLHDPAVRHAIENPKINDKNDVPYIAGSSSDLNDYTTHWNRSTPRAVEVSGVKFDAAEPANIHEQVERTVMERMIRSHHELTGRAPNAEELAEIYQEAHHRYAEPAEDAYYRARGISVDDVNRWWEQQDWHAEREAVKNPPPDLYTKPYPHNQIKGSPELQPAAFEEWAQPRPLDRRPLVPRRLDLTEQERGYFKERGIDVDRIEQIRGEVAARGTGDGKAATSRRPNLAPRAKRAKASAIRRLPPTPSACSPSSAAT